MFGIKYVLKIQKNFKYLTHNELFKCITKGMGCFAYLSIKLCKNNTYLNNMHNLCIFVIYVCIMHNISGGIYDILCDYWRYKVVKSIK